MLLTVLSTLLFLLLSVISPIMLDRTDRNLDTQQVIYERFITQQTVFTGGGWFQARIQVLPSETSSAIGLVCDAGATYNVDEDGFLHYSAPWVATASIDPNLGFYVIENGVVIFTQGQPYPGDVATIRVMRNGSFVEYYLNDEFMFTSPLSGMPILRGYVGQPDFASIFLMERGTLTGGH